MSLSVDGSVIACNVYKARYKVCNKFISVWLPEDILLQIPRIRLFPKAKLLASMFAYSIPCTAIMILQFSIHSIMCSVTFS